MTTTRLFTLLHHAHPGMVIRIINGDLTEAVLRVDEGPAMSMMDTLEDGVTEDIEDSTQITRLEMAEGDFEWIFPDQDVVLGEDCDGQCVATDVYGNTHRIEFTKPVAMTPADFGL